MGLFLRMFSPLNEPGTQINNTQTSPPDQKAPRIVSRLHTLENESKICRQAFLPGKHFTVPSLPNVTAVNALGGFSIARDRLAIIDGEGPFVYPYFGAFYFPPIPPRTTASPTPISPAYVRGYHTASSPSTTPPPFFAFLYPYTPDNSIIGVAHSSFHLCASRTIISIFCGVSIPILTASPQLIPGDP